MKIILFGMGERSTRNRELNRILDKISSENKLSHIEKEFIEHYSDIDEIDIQDYSLQSHSVISTKLNTLLEKNVVVICNLHDRNGKIGENILSITDNFIYTKNHKIELKDNTLYNLIYNIESKFYSLEVQGEYYEKLYIE